MPQAPAAGLCGLCAWSRRVAGAASTFIMCTRGLTDPDFRKYPPLPMLACRGFDPAPAAPGGGEAPA